MPPCRIFLPQGEERGERILLSLDEYEVIRLVDLEQKTHEQAACQMDISRSTVQEVYEAARRKLAACLVYGRGLAVQGGNCRICEGRERPNCRPCQVKRTDCSGDDHTDHKQGDKDMKIAVTYENGAIFQHFGHTQQFKLYEVQDGKVSGSCVLDTDGQGHGALAGFLMQQGVDTLICGGIGGGAQMALAAAGIRLFGGVSGGADEAVTALLEGRLSYDPDARCSHHDHAHGEGEHHCGSHGCGSHGCGDHGCH